MLVQGKRGIGDFNQQENFRWPGMVILADEVSRDQRYVGLRLDVTEKFDWVLDADNVATLGSGN